MESTKTLAAAVVDFHSHILPGVDDGSRSLEESLKLLKLEAAQGIRHVVATPHFYPDHDSPERFLRRREASARALRGAMAGREDLPSVSLGAEVHFYFGISESELLPELTIDGGKCVLVEMPRGTWTRSMYAELEGIWTKQGITPVIAHLDRYISPFRTHGIPEQLAELPVMVQANADFFLERRTSRMALRLLKEDRIHLLGSDCHDLKHRRPNLSEAVEKITEALGKEPIARIARNQRQLLAPAPQRLPL